MSENSNIPETITYCKAAARYNCDRQSIRRQVDAGRIRAWKPGKQVLLSIDDCDAWFWSTVIKPKNQPTTRRKRRW